MTETRPAPERPLTVFISYAHESELHQERVLALSAELRKSGVTTVLDDYQDALAQTWSEWTRQQIRDAAFVLIVCTAEYARRAAGSSTDTAQGRGVALEARLIDQDLFDSKSRNTKYVPVVFGANDEKFIPDFLRGYNWYDVGSKEGFIDLLRRITDQPKTEVPVVGPPIKLPVQTARPLSEFWPAPAGTFRVGDRVRILKPAKRNIDHEGGSVDWRRDMAKYVGHVATIVTVDPLDPESVKLDVSTRFWASEWLERVDPGTME